MILINLCGVVVIVVVGPCGWYFLCFLLNNSLQILTRPASGEIFDKSLFAVVVGPCGRRFFVIIIACSFCTALPEASLATTQRLHVLKGLAGGEFLFKEHRLHCRALRAISFFRKAKHVCSPEMRRVGTIG